MKYTMTGETRQRYNAFWSGDAYERCCLYLTGWSGAQGGPTPVSLTQQWEDPEFRVRAALWRAENMICYAEAFPTAFVNTGPGCLSAMLGGSFTWAKNTVWFNHEPLITDWGNAPAPVLQRESLMYRTTETITEHLLAAGACGQKYYTSIADIGGAYDILASLRGTHNLLLDLVDHPDKVKAYIRQIQPVLMEYFQRCAKRLIAKQGGVTSWMSIWSDTPWYPLQCDFSAMISPGMFEEFVLPDLRFQTEYMDRSVYHLDGPGELPHVKHLLSLPRLNAIQWTPGDGNENVGNPRWFGLYEEIQAAGKGLVLLGVKFEDLENLLRHVSTKGLYISCGCGTDAARGQEIMRVAEGFGVK